MKSSTSARASGSARKLLFGEGGQVRADPRRVPRRAQVRVAVDRVRQAALVQVIEKGSRQLGAARRAEADRAGEAGIERDAVVRPSPAAGRAGRPAPAGTPRRRGNPSISLSGASGTSAKGRGRREPPEAAARALDQEHVVGIEMRADAAAGRGVAHHHVVQARLRNEREAPQQSLRRARCDSSRRSRAASSCALPRALGRQARARDSGPCVTCQRSPRRSTRRDSTSSRAASANSARFLDHAAESGQCAAHEQRALLPVAAQKNLRRQAP